MLAAVLMMSTSCFNQYDVQSDGGTGIECMRDGYKTVDLVGCRGYVRTLGPPVDECRCTCDCSGGGIDYERLAAALAAQPIRISMSGREVASAVREELLRMGNSLTTLGLT